MGPLFVFLFWVIVIVSIGFLFGLLICYVGIPLYYKIRKTPEDKRKLKGLKKLIISTILGFVFSIVVIGLVLFGFTREIALVDNYWESRGFGDWYRMPLEYPYELFTTQLDLSADIRVWQKKRKIIKEITKYYKEGNIIVGEITPHAYMRDYLSRDHRYENVSTYETEKEYYARIDSLKEYYIQFPERKWFTFDCESGNVNEYNTYEEYIEAFKKLGFESEPELLTIWENWKIYWSNPRKTPDDFKDSLIYQGDTIWW